MKRRLKIKHTIQSITPNAFEATIGHQKGLAKFDNLLSRNFFLLDNGSEQYVFFQLYQFIHCFHAVSQCCFR